MFHVKHHLSRLAIGVSRETSSRGLLACWPMWARLRADVTSLWAGSVALLNSSVEHFGRDCDDGRMPAEPQNSPAHPILDAASDDRAGPESDGMLTAPAPPSVAEQVFAERLDVAQRYAAHLADTGISHGLIGPREVPRLWERHILNCAVIAEVIPEGASVIDVGSGAGPRREGRPDATRSERDREGRGSAPRSPRAPEARGGRGESPKASPKSILVYALPLASVTGTRGPCVPGLPRA